MEKSCFFPCFLFHCIPPCFRIEKGRIREAPSHAFPIGRKEKNIKGEGKMAENRRKRSAVFSAGIAESEKKHYHKKKEGGVPRGAAGKGKEKQ